MTKTARKNKASLYRITVEGALDSKWADWFGGLHLEPVGENQTALSGPVPDQAALHGILAKIRDLGLTLLSVRMFEGQETTEMIQKESGMSTKYRVHRFDIRMTSDKSKLEQFLNSLEGEIIAIFPNVTNASFTWAACVDFLLIVERLSDKSGSKL